MALQVATVGHKVSAPNGSEVCKGLFSTFKISAHIWVLYNLRMPDEITEGKAECDKSSRSADRDLEQMSQGSQANAEQLKIIESSRTHTHSGSAGGDDESIQIEALDAKGNKLIASRFTRVTEQDLLTEADQFSQSHMDLKAVAKSNAALEPVVNLRDYAERLPAADSKKETLKNLAREQFQSLTKPQDYVYQSSQDDAGTFKVLEKADGGIQLNIGLEASSDEVSERVIGGTIGIIESIGALSVDFFRATDFAAAVLRGDKQAAEESGAAFGELLGKSIIVGVNIFQKSYDYLYDVGFQSDAAKPFRDIVTLGSVLNSKWNELSPKEQERLRFRLIADTVFGAVPIGATAKANQATVFFEVLEEASAIAKEVNASEKTFVAAITNLSDDLSEIAVKELKPGEIWVGSHYGNWKVIDAIESPMVVKQSELLSCASACGEMLCAGIRDEAWFKQHIGVPSDHIRLAQSLSKITEEKWIGGLIQHLSLDEIMNQAPWSAVFFNNNKFNRFRHMVVVDGFSKDGLILLRDPANGFMYKMTESDFREVWEFTVVKDRYRE